jgi:hypothetical protein
VWSRYLTAVGLFLVGLGPTKPFNLSGFPNRGFVFFLPAAVMAALVTGLLPSILTVILSMGERFGSLSHR